MPSFKHLNDCGPAILSWRCYVCFRHLTSQEAATHFVQGIPKGGVLLSGDFPHCRLKALSDCLGGPTRLRTRSRPGYAPSASTSPYLCGWAHGRGLSMYDILSASCYQSANAFTSDSCSGRECVCCHATSSRWIRFSALKMAEERAGRRSSFLNSTGCSAMEHEPPATGATPIGQECSPGRRSGSFLSGP